MEPVATAYPPPAAFGLPESFVSWRQGQVRVWQAILDAPTRFVAVVAPTGAGKSLIYMTVGVLVDGRRVYLTATKGNQDQLEVFEPIGLLDIRGQDNYPCLAYEEGGDWYALRPDEAKDRTCHHGPCHVGLPCSRKDAGCTYFDLVRQAREYAEHISTNYAFWMAQRLYGQGLGDQVHLLVLDEAHLSDKELSGSLQIEIPKWLLGATGYKAAEGQGGTWGVMEWKKWAMWTSAEIKNVLDVFPGKSSKALQHRKRLQTLERTCRAMLTMGNEDWIPDHTQEAYVFECLNPHAHAEALLFQGAKKVVLTSATLTPKTLDLLGIPPEEVTWVEMPSTFPVARRPVIWVPTCRVDMRMTDLHWSMWADRMDQIVSQRPNWKGVIHTVAYARAKQYLQRSGCKDRLLVPGPGELAKAVGTFRASKSPLVLVSPSVMTGWDFPHDQCRFQIVSKLPFPDTRSKIVQARQELDKDYGFHLMMQNLVQAVGRGMRDETDWCETFIIDDNWQWAGGLKYRGFAPQWFWAAVRKAAVLPPPLQVAA